MSFAYLAIAIFSEVVGTLALKSSDGFTRTLPSVLVVLGYGSAFYFLSLCLKELKTGMVYAIWSGVGIVLISIAGMILHNQKIDSAGWLGIAVIIVGVVILNVFSSAKIH
ncbi:MAG: QacE family quaternary ammonium compound efflux SMR transporter [Verrucomicrobiales bacterium]|nr:QacE family quaternary ammonium compound efflux SMR transporter [Verrucomicrobiales bacterium]|tara:strand:- start:7913 stop:8242 length:330 start_codon:yes stop_codon:yes gene_type:complete